MVWRTQGLFSSRLEVAFHLRFYAVRKFLDLFGPSDYVNREDVLVAFVNVFLQLGGKLQEFLGGPLQVGLALGVGLFAHLFLHGQRDRSVILDTRRHRRVIIAPRGRRHMLPRLWGRVAVGCKQKKQQEKDNDCSMHNRPRWKRLS